MSYPGSKGQAGTWQRIIGQMPPHRVYVEPFLGSGQIFHRKRRAELSILIDLDKACIAKIGAGAPGVKAVCGDALSLLPGLGLTLPADAVVYCDPPYLLETRRGRKYYRHEMTDQDHDRLLEILCTLECRVLLSGYPSFQYSSRLAAWRSIEYQARTRGRTLTECLWCNFPAPTELHDIRYAGGNYRQRLSLKRLASRYLARLQAMPPLKRAFILEALSGLARAGSADAGATVPSAEADEGFYCPEHRYNPPLNSGFSLCPMCECPEAFSAGHDVARKIVESGLPLITAR